MFGIFDKIEEFFKELLLGGIQANLESMFLTGYQPVKVTLIQPILNDTVLFILALRKGFCNGSGDLSLISKNLCIIELQKSVQLGGPICHGHGNVPFGLPGGVVQIHGDDFVQLLHLIHG